MAERERLDPYLRDVAVARQHLEEARQVGTRGTDVERLRGALLTALEEYAGVIGRLGAPVPQRLQAEIDLYHRIRHRA